jgi:hypothetical protein
MVATALGGTFEMDGFRFGLHPNAPLLKRRRRNGRSHEAAVATA